MKNTAFGARASSFSPALGSTLTPVVEPKYRDRVPPLFKENSMVIDPQYHPDYYAAFVIGPDGHNFEAVCRKEG